MARGHSHESCEFGEDGLAYPPQPEHEFAFGRHEDRDQLFKDLSSALETLPDPVTACVQNLTANDVKSLLEALKVSSRGSVLRPLGMNLQATKVALSLASDARSRLRRTAQHERRHSAERLGSVLYTNMSIAAMAPVATMSVAHDKLSAHQPHALRLSLWAGVQSNARGARVLQWAAEQPWFALASASSDQLNAVIVAAEAVVDATESFNPFPTLRSGDPLLDTKDLFDVGEHAAADGEPDAIRAPDDSALGTASGQGASGVPADDGTGVIDVVPKIEELAVGHGGTRETAPAAGVSPVDLSAMLFTLEETLAAAAAEAQQVTAILDSGRPPAAHSMSVLNAALVAFEAAEAHLRSAGATVTERSATGLREALQAATRQRGEELVRAGLDAFTALLPPEDNAGLEVALSQGVLRARALLGSTLWSEEERSDAEAIAEIAEIASGTLDPHELLAAQARIVSAAPHLALLAVLAGTLMPQPSSDTRDSATNGEEVADDIVPSDVAGTREVSETNQGEASTDLESEEPEKSEPSSTTAAESSLPVQSVAMAALNVARAATPSATEEQPDTTTTTSGATDNTAATGPVAGKSVDQLAEPDDDTMYSAVATLVSQGRHALAAALAGRCTDAPADPHLLRTSALSGAVRNPHGQVASALRQHVNDLDSPTITGDTTSLLLAAPTLLRIALVTGEPAAGAVLLDLAPHLGDQLGLLATQVGRRAVQGVLVASPPLTALSDLTETERVLAEAQAEAEELLRPRRLRFKRASDIVNGWLAPDGVIGEALTVVVHDDRDRIGVVTATIAALNDPSEITRAIESQDRRLRSGSSSKALQGSVRNDLITVATDAIKPLSSWYEAVSALTLGDQGARWSDTEVAEMRSAVLDAGPAALHALEARAGAEDPLVSAAAISAHASLGHTLALLDGSQQVGAMELAPADVLGMDALRIRGTRVSIITGEVSLPDELRSADVAGLLTRSWDEAVRLHVDDENFPAAHRLLHAAQAGMLPDTGDGLAEETVALVASREHTSRQELGRNRDLLAAELRKARTNNQINEEQDAELTAMLRDSERAGPDLARVRATLEQISRSLPDYRERSAQSLRDRLAQAQTDNHRVGEDDVARVNDFIDRGDLGTAEELIYLLANNEPLPSPRPHEHLKLFFPHVPDALPDGITDSLIAIARESGVVASCPTLDFSTLSPDQAALTADALASWRVLGATPPEKRYRVSENDSLLPALRVAGLEAKKTLQLADTPRARDRRFVDVGEVTVNGKAMVPALGSNAGDRRRVLLAWGQPSAETLMSWVDQNPAGDTLIVAHFGTMSPAVRRELAELTPSSQAPVIVLDDAALVYLAARGDRLLEATMMILLPFAHVNPYIRQKRGLVAKEMFYGRKDEQRQVIDKDGTQIIYGGRGLGKSALLRDAESEFERSSPTPGTRVAIYLSLDDLRIGAGKAMGAETLWDGLLNALIQREVIPAKGAIRLGKDAHSKVVAGITAWLGQDSARRLLILLDESDRFFEADAPAFGETSRLRNLGTTTRDRAKVVLAGLHSVQRFAKVASNGPFSHLAQRPTVIGPLRPQSAFNLLVEPMAAMGYEFEEPDLINRVLANCSYQPFLLQMFGHRLVERMHKQRRELGAQLPYKVTRADIDAVESNEELREDISAAFRDTLNLDPRYNVIANVMARNAHESGLEARLTDTELLEECVQWWADGFTHLDTAAFRSYLSEMVGLGVLARNTDGLGWRLRGPAVLNMVGTASDVENQLLGAETESLRDEFVALATREKMEDGSNSPLTAGQLDDLLGHHSVQVRLVMGSDATGIADAASAVRAAAAIGDRFTVPAINSRSAFESAITGGYPGERRVIISDLTDKGAEVCTATLRAAVEQTPDKPGVTRAVVLVAGAHQLPFWREVLEAQESTPSLGTVALQRYNIDALRVWSMVSERFSASARIEKVMAATGGWPYLVAMVAAHGTAAAKELGAIEAAERHLATDAGGEELIRRVGLRGDDELARAYSDLVTVLASDSADLADLHAAVADATTDPELVIGCLMALGVFTPVDKGQYQLEFLLSDAWTRLTQSQA